MKILCPLFPFDKNLVSLYPGILEFFLCPFFPVPLFLCTLLTKSYRQRDWEIEFFWGWVGWGGTKKINRFQTEILIDPSV